MKKISVIVPSYRPGKYIEDCIISLSKQLHIPKNEYEVLIILNGSTEEHFDYVNELINDKSQFRLIKVDSEGVSNARNIGIENSIGEYITFVDDDDIVSDDYLYGLLSVADKESISIASVHSFQTTISNCTDNFFICNKFQSIDAYKNTSLARQRSFISYVAGKMIHREIIKQHRFNIHFKNGEDSLFMTSITENVKRIRFAHFGTYFVREREGSASRKSIPLKQIIKDSTGLIIEYIKTYISSPKKYSFSLFILRIPGVLKNSYSLLKNK